jgi:hypothetical protein
LTKAGEIYIYGNADIKFVIRVGIPYIYLTITAAGK